MKMITKEPLLKVTSRTASILGVLRCGLVAWAALCVVSIAAAQPSEQETLKLLQRFVGEFVEITPGRGRFPAQFVYGPIQHNNAKTTVLEVAMTKNFSIAKYEVYQNLYEAVMGNNPSRWQGPRNSAERMTFAEANLFCKKLTALLREHQLIAANQLVRLPTEVEWEYCARAGTQTGYSFGDDPQQKGDQGNQATLLDAYAWHTGNAAGNDPEVGVLKPNPWGLYDVHGYLWEYCLDHWSEDLATSAKSPHQAVTNESGRVVVRGGSWKDPFTRLTSSSRLPFPQNGRDDAVGFRCVLVQE